MTFYRRRLPHLYDIGQPIFLTWRLQNSLPANRVFPAGDLSSGQSFAALDRLLKEARSGPLYLHQPAIAEMVVEAIHRNASVLRHYVLHAFTVMPNYVHLLVNPSVPLPKLTKSLKGITAKRANAQRRGRVMPLLKSCKMLPTKACPGLNASVGYLIKTRTEQKFFWGNNTYEMAMAERL